MASARKCALKKAWRERFVRVSLGRKYVSPAKKTYTGWRGLLVEAQPDSAAALLINRGARNTVVAEAVCATAGGFVEFWGGAGDLRAGSVETMRETTKGWYERRLAHAAKEGNASKFSRKVPCRPFGDMLRRAGFSQALSASPHTSLSLSLAFSCVSRARASLSGAPTPPATSLQPRSLSLSLKMQRNFYKQALQAGGLCLGRCGGR